MERIPQDLRLALRALTRRPEFFLAVTVTLGLGIGLNTAVFSLVSALLTEPLQVEEPHRLLRVYRHSTEDVMTYGPLAWRDLDELREQTRSFNGLAGYAYSPLAMEHGSHHRLAMGEVVTENYFKLLGVSASRGRVFGEQDALRPVAVLSHRAWRQWFGGAPEAVGSDLVINGQGYLVIGVAAEGFGGLTRGLSSEVWLPLESRRWQSAADPWVVGRLAPGVDRATAQSEVALIGERLEQGFAQPREERELLALPADEVRLLPQLDGALLSGSAVASVLVALILALAAVNVGHLMLARSLGRRREVATRRALGAGRGAIFRLLIAEGLVLSVVGGMFGLLLAFPLLAGLGALDVPLPVDVGLHLKLDHRAVAFTFLLSLLLAVSISLAPGRSLARLKPARALAGGPMTSGRHRRSNRILIPAQVALSLVLLLGAGLCLQSFWHAQEMDPGFEGSAALVATLAPRLQGYEPEAAERFYDDLLERVRNHPQVASAGWTSHLPLTFELHADRVAKISWENEEWLSVDSAGAGPGYFESLRIPLEEGRAFSALDHRDAPPVAVLNRTLATRLWPRGDALGRTLRLDHGEAPVELQVVGIAGDGKYRTLGEPSRPFLYRPLAQGGARSSAAFVNTGTRTLVVRTEGPAEEWTGTLRHLIRTLDPQIAVSQLSTLESALAIVLWLPQVTAVAFGFFGLLALALAATGIYGVLSFSVHQRRHELGIRLALGARPWDLRRLVLGEALLLTGIGVLLGILASTMVTRLLTLVLYQISPTDGATLGSVSALLLLVALAAAHRPARRAAQTAAMDSLRSE